MTEKEQDTEELIFEAACRVFQQKGYDGARMQEIADEADINKSMLHYYYRSKEKLFQMVFQREISRFFPIIFKVLNSADPFDLKLDRLIDAYYSFLRDNPHMAPFILYEINQHPQKFRAFIKEQGIRPPEQFFRQIREDISEGRMKEVDPRQLMISVVGLILFPFIAGTMLRAVFSLDDADYLKFLRERKGFLKDFILSGINYQSP